MGEKGVEMTSRQAEIVNTILRYQREHGHWPTWKKLVALLGLRSNGSLGDSIASLRMAGYVAYDTIPLGTGLRVLKPPYEEIYRMVGGELMLAPLGKARMAGVWDG